MRLLVFSLTGLAVILLAAQFFGKKETREHKIRGILVNILTIAVVIINTWDISMKNGLTWDFSFIIHTVVGGLFFISLAATSVTGYLLGKNKTELKIVIHNILATITAMYLFLTLFTILLIRFFR